MTVRKADYHIEDFASSAVSGDWSLAINAAMTQMKSDMAAWNTADGTSTIAAGRLRLGARQYNLKSVVNTIDFPLHIEGVQYQESASTWTMGGSVLLIPSSNLNTRFNITGLGAIGFRIDKIAIREIHSLPTDPAVSWAPNAFDYVFKLTDTSDIHFGDVFFCGVNKAIKVERTGRVHIDRITGHVYTRFMWADKVLDACHFGSIHLWPFVGTDWRIMQYQQGNMVPFELGRTDGIFINSLFALGGNAGFLIFHSANSATPPQDNSGTTTNLQVGRAYFDFFAYGINVPSADVSGAVLKFDSLTVQHEAAKTGGGANGALGDGSPIPGGVSIAASGTWCQFMVDKLHDERAQSAVIWAPGTSNVVHIGMSRYFLRDYAHTGTPAHALAPGNSVYTALPAFDVPNP